MKFTAATFAVAVLAIGVTLGGCATSDSVLNALNAADAADSHAGRAQARADEAYGVGNNALGVGNGAMTAAQRANMKADANAGDVTQLTRRVANLEYRMQPHHKKTHHRVHHTTAMNEKPKNS
jgi:uncharacterized NAD(P)/FAD-binding protein YdhS